MSETCTYANPYLTTHVCKFGFRSSSTLTDTATECQTSDKRTDTCTHGRTHLRIHTRTHRRLNNANNQPPSARDKVGSATNKNKRFPENIHCLVTQQRTPDIQKLQDDVHISWNCSTQSTTAVTISREQKGNSKHPQLNLIKHIVWLTK